MRGFGIDIRGINRKVGSSSNDVGFCSELINLKQDNGVKVVPQKEIVSANIPYKRVSLHRIGKKINYIGIKDDATGVSVVHFDPKSGEEIYTFKTFSAGSEIHYSLLNNQVVISDKTAVKEYVYKFDGTYSQLYNGYEFNPSIELLSSLISSTDTNEKILAPSKEQYVGSLQAAVNKFEKENPEYCEGYFLYAFTLTYYDGTEDTMFGLNFMNASRNSAVVKDFITVTGYDNTSSNDQRFIKTNFAWSGYYKRYAVKMNANQDLYDKFKGLVKNVNMYVSKPITKYPLTRDNVSVGGMGWNDNELSSVVSLSVTPQNADKTGLEKTLLYKQKTWSLEEFCDGIYEYLRFGGDEQTTGATMEVYGSNIDRAGKMYTYNNRVHFYDSKVRLLLNGGNVTYSPYKSYADVGFNEYIEATATVLAYLKSSTDTLVYRYDNCNVILANTAYDSEYKLVLADMVMFDDTRVNKLEFVITGSKPINYDSVMNKKFEVTLSPSPAYNYAYCFGGPANTIKSTGTFSGTYPTLVDTYDETEVINVSAGGNPMVFPVAHSYKFKGNITAVSVATDAISDVQVGQYPLTVFTDNGIFALEQGNGEVLYSNIVPISNDVCVNDSVLPIRQGIAYIAHNSLWVLSGRNSTKMSELLEGNIDTNIQNNESFTKCCCGNLYNISQSLSQVDFRTFVKDANLSWSPTSNEIIVSNKAYNYSYVYDFINNSWYKVIGIFDMVEDNMVLQHITVNSDAATPATGVITLQAIHTESSRTFASLCQAGYDQTLTCSAGDTMALIIDGTQVASATFSQTTKMNMIVATLCEKVSYLEDTKGVIYSRTELSGKVVKIHNTTTNVEVVKSTFASHVQSVTIPNKAIGATVSVSVNGVTYNSTLTDGSSVVTLLNNLATQMNTSEVVTAQVVKNTIVVTSKIIGAVANNISLSATSNDPDYIYLSTTPMSGGKDISLIPSEYKQIVDWVDEVKGKEQTIHLHTRPLHLGDNNTYKTIKRTALNCLADLKGNQNLSLYIFASDNLTTFKCVCAAQRKDCTVSQIIADRSAKAYKYFVFMIGGIVTDTTQIHNIITSVEDIADKKIR